MALNRMAAAKVGAGWVYSLSNRIDRPSFVVMPGWDQAAAQACGRRACMAAPALPGPGRQDPPAHGDCCTSLWQPPLAQERPAQVWLRAAEWWQLWCAALRWFHTAEAVWPANAWPQLPRASRFAATQGAALRLLSQSYISRDYVAVLPFHGDRAEVRALTPRRAAMQLPGLPGILIIKVLGLTTKEHGGLSCTACGKVPGRSSGDLALR